MSRTARSGPIHRARTILVAVPVLAAAAGIGYYLWVARRAVEPPPPVPAELTDPPARKVIEDKRRAVLAALKRGTAWGELAMAFDAHDASAEATVCYRRAMDLDPKDARWPFLLAAQLNGRAGSISDRSSTEDKEEAVRLYRRAAECRPPSSAHRVTALLTLADLLTELGRGDEAVPLYEQAYDFDPSDPRAAYSLGKALADRDNTEEAAQILLHLARNPYARKKSAIAMAELNRRAGRAKDADGFEYAASLLPPDHHWANPFTAEVADLRRDRRVLVNRYDAQEAAHAYKAAVNTATALADQYPSVESQMFLLKALVNAKDYPAALAVADDILRDEEGRKLVNAHSFLGRARIGLADRAEAEGRKADADKLLAQAAEALGESVRLKADYAPGYIYQAQALRRLGRLPEAEKAARAGVVCRPEEWEGYLELSNVLAASGRKADAITAAEQAVKLAHPDEPRPKQALEALKK
jgi:tetratricopeptide (TPR) repeat protein